MDLLFLWSPVHLSANQRSAFCTHIHASVRARSQTVRLPAMNHGRKPWSLSDTGQVRPTDDQHEREVYGRTGGASRRERVWRRNGRRLCVWRRCRWGAARIGAHPPVQQRTQQIRWDDLSSYGQNVSHLPLALSFTKSRYVDYNRSVARVRSLARRLSRSCTV